MIDNDDRPIGRILSRREVLALFGAASGALLISGCTPIQPGAAEAPAPSVALPTVTPASASAAVVAADATVAQTLPTCVVRPEQTEGPYFVDEGLNRSDIRANTSNGAVSEGVPLVLTFQVSQVSNSACNPLADAQVDIWHCDALGVYSDVNNAVGQDFLRGYQLTDATGLAQFTTIYPGWYQGRTVHIHFKIRTAGATGAVYDFTSQLYFDDALSDQVFTQQPYASRGTRNQRNENDGVFRNGGDQLLLNLTPTDAGYAATFDIGLDLS